MHILTHRGLNPSKKNYFKESSLEAFVDQLHSGFGLEFDIQFTKDNQIIISHEDNLKRISSLRDTRKLSEMNSAEILSMDFEGCHLVSLKKLLTLIEEKQSPKSISAIHIKYNNQQKEKLDILLDHFNGVNTSTFILFDLTIEAAQYLKEKKPELNLACSVSHTYDIERFNSVVGGTLVPLEKALENNALFSWFWLDEWDTKSKDGLRKKLYTKETFDKIRQKKIKIALVTPELHATSPHLLGGEFHEDAQNTDILFSRIKEIISLHPDAVCTDYPDFIKNIIYHDYPI